MTFRMKFVMVAIFALFVPTFVACGGSTSEAKYYSDTEMADALESLETDCNLLYFGSSSENYGLEGGLVGGVSDIFCYDFRVLFVTDEEGFNLSLETLCGEGPLEFGDFKTDLVVGKNFIAGAFHYGPLGMSMPDNPPLNPDIVSDLQKALGGKLVQYSNLTEQWC